MAFNEYRNYTASELKDIFKIEIQRNEDLFTNFKPSDRDYTFLQENVKDLKKWSNNIDTRESEKSQTLMD